MGEVCQTPCSTSTLSIKNPHADQQRTVEGEAGKGMMIVNVVLSLLLLKVQGVS